MSRKSLHFNASPAPVSRRDLAKLVSGAAAGALAYATGCASPEKKPMNAPPKNEPAKPAPASETASLDAMEKTLAVSFSEAQRKALPRALKEMNDTSAALRKYALQDGGSEPGVIFRPTNSSP